MSQGEAGSGNAHYRDAMRQGEASSNNAHYFSHSHEYDYVNCEQSHVHSYSETQARHACQASPKANGQPKNLNLDAAVPCVKMIGRELLWRTTVHQNNLYQYLASSLSTWAKSYETEVADIMQQISQVVAHADVKTDFRWSLGQTELVVQLISERTDPWWEVLLSGRIQDATENARVALPSFSHSTRSETHDIGRACTLAKGPSRVQPPPVVDKQPSSGHNESTYWSLPAGVKVATAAVQRHWKSWSDDENGSNSWLVGAEPRVKVLEQKSSYCTTVQQRNMPQYLAIALTMLAEVDDAEAQGTVGQIIQAVNMFGVQTGDAGHITEAVAELHVQTGFRWQSKPYSLGGVELSVHLTLLKPAQNVQDQLWEVLAFVFSKEETKMECIAQPFAHPALAIGNNEMPVHEYDDSSAIRHMPIELYF